MSTATDVTADPEPLFESDAPILYSVPDGDGLRVSPDPHVTDECSFTLGDIVLVGKVASSRFVSACLNGTAGEYRSHMLLELEQQTFVAGEPALIGQELVMISDAFISKPQPEELVLVAAADGGGELVARVVVWVSATDSFAQGRMPSPDSVVDLPDTFDELKLEVASARQIPATCADHSPISDADALSSFRTHDDDPCTAEVQADD